MSINDSDAADPPGNDSKRGNMLRRLSVGSLARRMRKNWMDNPFCHLVLWVAAPVLAAYIFGEQAHSFYLRPDLLGIALIISAALLIAVNSDWDALKASVLRMPPPAQWNVPFGYLLVGVAIALRLVLQTYMPPPFTGFEEYQMGGQSMRAAQGDGLSIPHTSSIIMGKIGFALGDNSIDSLRMVFRLSGALSILVMAMTLRRLSVGWTATVIAAFVMSSLPLLVIGSGVADELFSDVLFETLLLYCVVSSIKCRELSLMWAGLSGVFAGILAYGYDSYLLLPALPMLYWFFTALFAVKSEEEGRKKRRLALRSVALYLLIATLIALPVIYLNLPGGEETSWQDRIGRHWAGREQQFGSQLYFESILSNAWAYSDSLLGHWRTEDIRFFNEPPVPMVLGMWFLLSFIYALLKPGNQFIRIVALSIPASILFLAAFVNNHWIGRLVPAIPILVLLSGIALDATIRRFQPLESSLFSRKRIAWMSFPLLLGAVVVAVNVSDALRLSSSEAFLSEFSNNQYPICKAIGAEPLEFTRVYVYGNGHCDLNNDGYWIRPDSGDVSVENYGIDTPFMDESEYEPGSLILLGHNKGQINGQKIREFVFLATRLRSEHTLRSEEGMQNRVTALTFCYLCENKDSK